MPRSEPINAMNMKNLIIIAAALLVAAAPLGAQTRRELRNARTDAASAARTIRKEKFRMVELGDVETRLGQFFTKVNGGCVQVVGIADGCVSANLAKMTALNNAAVEYASNSGGKVRGRITSDASTVAGGQVDAIVAAYERLVLKEINGELVPFITLLRKGRDGGYDARVYCLVDRESAHSARMRAMELALEETRMAERYGSMISDWIDEGFSKLDMYGR